MRIHSEAVWVNWEDVDWDRGEIIVRGDPETGTQNSEMRRVPIIADMRGLLVRLKDKLGTGDASVCVGPILKLRRCNEALARACQEVGITKLTHHDLRHLFAPRCIESGVDIPTVSRWLGHKDGGALSAWRRRDRCSVGQIPASPRRLIRSGPASSGDGLRAVETGSPPTGKRRRFRRLVHLTQSLREHLGLLRK